VALVAVDAHALGLAAVAQLRILDRDPPVPGDTLAQPHDAVGADHGVLALDLAGRGQPGGDLGITLSAKLANQFLDAADRRQHHPQRTRQRGLIVPVQVQRRLQTGGRHLWRACPLGQDPGALRQPHPC
jgi:hypothetical protein